MMSIIVVLALVWVFSLVTFLLCDLGSDDSIKGAFFVTAGIGAMILAAGILFMLIKVIT